MILSRFRIYLLHDTADWHAASRDPNMRDLENHTGHSKLAGIDANSAYKHALRQPGALLWIANTEGRHYIGKLPPIVRDKEDKGAASRAF
jgi:hypothetical protein